MLQEDDFELIMDDEKRFTLTNELISTNRRFYTYDPSVTSSEVKFRYTQTYSARILIWIGVCEKDIPKSFVAK